MMGCQNSGLSGIASNIEPLPAPQLPSKRARVLFPLPPFVQASKPLSTDISITVYYNLQRIFDTSMGSLKINHKP